MATFLGKVQVFNGRYWRPITIDRFIASDWSAASGRALRLAKKQFKKGERFERVTLDLTRLQNAAIHSEPTGDQ